MSYYNVAMAADDLRERERERERESWGGGRFCSNNCMRWENNLSLYANMMEVHVGGNLPCPN